MAKTDTEIYKDILENAKKLYAELEAFLDALKKEEEINNNNNS